MIFWVSFINFSFKVAGINTVMYYAAKIISMAGYSDNTQVNKFLLTLSLMIDFANLVVLLAIELYCLVLALAAQVMADVELLVVDDFSIRPILFPTDSVLTFLLLIPFKLNSLYSFKTFI